MAINSLSASSYGLSGLVSGMDTQSMVTKMLSGTQSKIDKAVQQKTVLQYKQSMYRDVATQLKSLQSSYLSFTSSTNLLSNTFYNNMTASIKTATGVSAAFSVSASTNAKVGSVTMDKITQLATARTSKTTEDATGEVSGTMSKEAAQKLLESYSGYTATMNIRVGSTTISIADAAAKFGGQSPSKVAEMLNEEFAKQTDANGKPMAEAKFVNNKLQIVAANKDDYIEITAGSGSSVLGMQMFGSNATTIGGKGTFSAAIDTDQYLPGFEVDLDGRTQTIRVGIDSLRDYVDNGSMDKIRADIEEGLLHAFGSGVKLADVDPSNPTELTFEPGKASQKFTISGNYQMMSSMGLKSGISNKLNTNLSLRDLNFATDLQGNKQTFSINGVEFSYDAGASLATIIDDVNNSKAGVKISYSESEDRFVIQSAETGEGSKAFDIKNTEGNLMTVLFGADGGDSMTTESIQQPMTGGRVEEGTLKNGGQITINVNGIDHKFSVTPKKDSSFSNAAFATALNEKLASAFGKTAEGKQVIEVAYDYSTKQFTYVANKENTVIKTTAYDKDTNNLSLGMDIVNGQSNLAASAAGTLANAGIAFSDGSKIAIDLGSYGSIEVDGSELSGEGTTFQNVVDKINAAIVSKMKEDPGFSSMSDEDILKKVSVSYDEKTAAFRVMGVDIPMEIAILGDDDSKNLTKLFGKDSIKVGGAGNPALLDPIDPGKNAVFSINGVEMERASNTFTIDGLTYTLNSTTFKDQAAQTGDHEAASQVVVARDTEKILEGIKSFVEQYNETINYITGLLRADTTYKDYAPLTSDQKAAMSETEIANWEEKAKEGLLRSDSTLEAILQSMRTAMYTKPEGSSIAIYDLGISTSFYSGEAVLGINNESDLLSMIEQDPEAIRKLFAGDGGVMEKLNDAINNAVRSSSTNPGTLVSVAGSSALDTNSAIYKQIKELDSQMTSLESRYWNEYDRYWSQFNSMEQMLSQLNSQSSWLSQMGG